MSFVHEPFEFETLECQTDHSTGIRHYQTPNGLWVPSITTILSAQDKSEGLKNWVERVGEREAEKIKNQCASLGTELHDGLENHLSNKPSGIWRPDAKASFIPIRNWVDEHVTKVYNLEIPVYSEKLGAAGTCDVFAEIDHSPAVADYKTARSFKKPEWITNYWIQTAFYAAALYELTGIVCKDLYIIMIVKESELMVYTQKTKDWVKPMKELIGAYHDDHK